VSRRGVDDPTGGHFCGVWLFEKHCKTGFWGFGKRVSCAEKRMYQS